MTVIIRLFTNRSQLTSNRKIVWHGVTQVRTLDLFCGAGGSSWGAMLAGAEVVAGIDSSPVAGDAFQQNFPEARFIEGQLEQSEPSRIRRQVGTIDLMLASPECTNHSPAKGNSPRSEKSKATAFQVVRYAEVFRPRWIVIENVTSMRGWKRFPKFWNQLSELGYKIKTQVLNAEHHGVPQSRRRLFLLCDLRQTPTDLPKPKRQLRPVASVLSRNQEFEFAPLRTERRAKATLERADRAIAAVGDEPFLIVYYGSDKGGGWQRLDRPLRTITTLDRFALVTMQGDERVMRMLQVPELKAAMGMPQRFSLGDTTRRNSIRMIGNAVCPPVMRDVIQHLTANEN